MPYAVHLFLLRDDLGIAFFQLQVMLIPVPDRPQVNGVFLLLGFELGQRLEDVGDLSLQSDKFHLLNADCKRLAPTKAVNKNQYGLTK